MNIKHIKIKNKEDLIKILYICHTYKTRLFKIIYLRDNTIIDYELINLENNYKTMIYIIVRRMYQLNANRYYIIRDNKAKIRIRDIILAIKIANGIQGLKGYIIIGFDTYSLITYIEKKIKIQNKLKVDKLVGQNPEKTIINNPKLNIKLNCTIDVVKQMQHIRNSNKYSLLLLTDNRGNLKFIKEVPYTFINMTYNQISQYIQKQKLITNSQKTFIITMDKLFFNRSVPLIKDNIIAAAISYMIINNNIVINDYMKEGCI